MAKVRAEITTVTGKGLNKKQVPHFLYKIDIGQTDRQKSISLKLINLGSEVPKLANFWPTDMSMSEIVLD